MPLPIEDYAILGDAYTAALVGKDGSVDWLCLPRFDSPACFAALLGEPRHGRWLIAPAGGVRAVRRRYRGASLVLETELDTDGGTVRLVDFMTPRDTEADLVRIVEGVRGEVPMRMELVIRFDYGSIVPWVRRLDGLLHAVGGPDALTLATPVATEGRNYTTCAEFVVRPGDRVPFVLAWHRSHEGPPAPPDAFAALEDTVEWWRQWTSQLDYDGEFRDEVLGSLLALKALTYAPTGGIVAAASSSLPELIGGVRNWDYRYCWLRDATFTLSTLIAAGFRAEAEAWRDWLLRSVAGEPSKLQILYGVGGERRVPEREIPWLPGYLGSAPVRIGNGAVDQLQLDVYGEVIDAMHQARRAGLPASSYAWHVQRALLGFLAKKWREPDEGIWEVRGPRRHFTHSKVMCWVAFDRAVKAVEHFGLEGEVVEWRVIRDAIREEVLARAWDPERRRFKMSYDSSALDASLLRLPLVGFIPPDDPRMLATVRAIENELTLDGLVMRYGHEDTERFDGFPPGEGAFIVCSFWLVDNYALSGRREEARRLFERLLALRNDVGLLAEEYDPRARRQLGNFPQAYSHVGLVDSAMTLARGQVGPAEQRMAAD